MFSTFTVVAFSLPKGVWANPPLYATGVITTRLLSIYGMMQWSTDYYDKEILIGRMPLLMLHLYQLLGSACVSSRSNHFFYGVEASLPSYDLYATFQYEREDSIFCFDNSRVTISTIQGRYVLHPVIHVWSLMTVPIIRSTALVSLSTPKPSLDNLLRWLCIQLFISLFSQSTHYSVRIYNSDIGKVRLWR